MDNEKFQDLVLKQFEKIDQRFEKMEKKMDQRFEKMENDLCIIKEKQIDHDIRFDNVDRNIDIIALRTKQLIDNENDVVDLIVKRKQRSISAF